MESEEKNKQTKHNRNRLRDIGKKQNKTDLTTLDVCIWQGDGGPGDVTTTQTQYRGFVVCYFQIYLYTVVLMIFNAKDSLCRYVFFLMLHICVPFSLFFPRKLGVSLILGVPRSFLGEVYFCWGSRFPLKWLANAENPFH